MDEVLIRYGDSAQETATLLLGAADELDYEPYVVRYQPDDAGFRVPKDVAKKAGLKPADEDAEAEAAEAERQEQIDVVNSEAGVGADGKPVDQAPADEPKKLTPKQESMAKAEALGLSTNGTQAQIDKRIAAAEKK